MSLVRVTEDGRLYAFVLGTGLIRTTEERRSVTPEWDVVSRDLGDRIPLHLAVDPTDPERLYLATRHSELLMSADGGRTWSAFGSDKGNGGA